MAEHLVPSSGGGPAPLGPVTGQPAAWGHSAAPPPVMRSPIERPLAAMRRYKWVMLVIVVVISLAGVVASRIVKPQYEVAARIMIASDDAKGNPIKGVELVTSDDWTQLLRTF